MFDKQQQQPTLDDVAKKKRSRTKHDLEHQKTRLRRNLGQGLRFSHARPRAQWYVL